MSAFIALRITKAWNLDFCPDADGDVDETNEKLLQSCQALLLFVHVYDTLKAVVSWRRYCKKREQATLTSFCCIDCFWLNVAYFYCYVFFVYIYLRSECEN